MEVEALVATLGFFRQKTKSIVGLSKKLVELHGGEVPAKLDELVKLPGVGRKTANVVLGVVWNTPEGVVVDTHVQRISQRLGWTKHNDPVKIELDLMKRIPREQWDMTAHLLIFHGRRICFAKKPNCEGCALQETCPSAFRAENVGRKPRPPRPDVPKKKTKAAPKKKKKATKRSWTVTSPARACRRRGRHRRPSPSLSRTPCGRLPRFRQQGARRPRPPTPVRFRENPSRRACRRPSRS